MLRVKLSANGDEWSGSILYRRCPLARRLGGCPKPASDDLEKRRIRHFCSCLESMHDFIIIRPLALSTYRLCYPGTIYVRVTCRLNKKNYTIVCHVPTEATSSVTVANEAFIRQGYWNLLDKFTLESRSIVLLIRLWVRLLPFPQWKEDSVRLEM
jgi:hypothetical protein